MTNDELVKKFNPANAGTLSQEDLEIFRGLSNDELKVLAQAYPNSPSRKPYLILYDNNVKPEKQLFSLSTYQNLYNVRKFSNLNNFVPYDFRSVVFPTKTRPITQKVSRPGAKNPVAPGKKILVDLSANEAAAELRQAIGGKENNPDPTAKETGQATAPAAKKETPAPVVKMKTGPGSNPAQDAIDKAIKKKPETKKVVTEKTQPATSKVRGKVVVDVSKPGDEKPPAE